MHLGIVGLGKVPDGGTEGVESVRGSLKQEASEVDSDEEQVY
jgi:hypothetical protein